MKELQRPFITEKIKLDSLPGKFLWNADSIEAYFQNINHPDVRREFQDFENQKFKDLDTSVAAFNKIIVDVARSSTKYVKNALNIEAKRKNNKPWFNQSCKDLRNTLKKYENLVRKNPSNGSYRRAFYTYKSRFRKLCHYQAKQFKESV